MMIAAIVDAQSPRRSAVAKQQAIARARRPPSVTVAASSGGMSGY
jgi:hypothetical protein